MRVEDFMQPKVNGRVVEDKYTFMYEIYSFESISWDKRELLESMYNYVSEFSLNAEVSHLTGDRTALIQSETDNGYRCLVRFNLLSVEDWDDERHFGADNTQYISEEEYNRRLNKYRRVGSQYIGLITFTLQDSNFNSVPAQIYYSEDKRIFVSETIADLISKTDVNKLGSKLAFIARKPMNLYSRDIATNEVLRRRYEKGLNNNLYQVKNGKLYMVNTINRENSEPTKKLSLFEKIKKNFY